jgi:hypothetical protein
VSRNLMCIIAFTKLGGSLVLMPCPCTGNWNAMLSFKHSNMGTQED